MGLTRKKDTMEILPNYKKSDEYTVCIAGNPNVGKSSLFNILTSLKQHTGNWPGKTVSSARGSYNYLNHKFALFDVPGTYSLKGLSEEEIIARDFICFADLDAVIVVGDATALNRSLELLFQVMEYNKNVIFVVNLVDEAKKKNITINPLKLEYYLGIPVVVTSAKKKTGIEKLKKAVYEICDRKYAIRNFEISFGDKIESEIDLLNTEHQLSRVQALRYLDNNTSFIDSMQKYKFDDYQKIVNISDKRTIDNVSETIMITYAEKAREVLNKTVIDNIDKNKRDIKIDNIITSRFFGIPLMILLLGIVFYITISFANIPSGMIFDLLFLLEEPMYDFMLKLGASEYISGLFIYGGYRGLAWVISVMLPPMAIFFPLFTLLEDLGYLPRVAYNLDRAFHKCGAHGKQCLSMCMGFGCNAAGIIGTRIIDSKKEKLIAIITNNFVPCNGRFPTIIAISSSCFAVTSSIFLNNIIPALSITFLVVLGVMTTFLVSYALSKTVLSTETSTFTLELPPYRVPNIFKVIYTSIIDRTLFVLGRALIICFPSGMITWFLGNTYINEVSILTHLVQAFDGFGYLLGLDGVIIVAFILGIPANEIVLPIIIMLYANTGMLTEFDSISSLQTMFIDNGWTLLTAINILLFSLLHWPCSTSLLTIKKETGSIKWTLVAFIIPTIISIVVCMGTAFIYRLVF